MLKKFFDAIFEPCSHEWVVEKKHQFLNYEEPEEGQAEEVVSQHDYSLLRCRVCKATKYDKL